MLASILLTKSTTTIPCGCAQLDHRHVEQARRFIHVLKWRHAYLATHSDSHLEDSCLARYTPVLHGPCKVQNHGSAPKPLDDLMTDAASVMQTAIDTSHALSRQADGKGSESITSKHRVHAICRKRHPGVCKPRLIRVLSAAYATAVRCYCRFGCVAFKLSFITKLPRGGRY